MTDRTKSRPNRTGRGDQREHWTKMLRTTMEAPAWRGLSAVAQSLYPWLKFEWKGPDANNNGAIRLSVRQAAKSLGVSNDTAARAFRDLQAKGYVVMTEHAVLGVEGAAKSPAFELCELALPGKQEGRKLYLTWAPGRDYPVQSASPNNPTGRNGKTKPCPAFKDSTVLELRTVRK